MRPKLKKMLTFPSRKPYSNGFIALYVQKGAGILTDRVIIARGLVTHSTLHVNCL